MKHLFPLIAFFTVLNCAAQSEYYLIGKESEVRINMVNNNPQGESVYFDAKPVVRYKFYNNIKKRLLIDSISNASNFHIIFSPHIRMYREISAPVKMPSYQVGLGFQQVWKLKSEDSETNEMITMAVESGHYSNGQSGCTFDESQSDATIPCDNINRIMNGNQNINLSQVLNRTNGHFQTNFSSLQLNYRFFKRNSSDSFEKSHSFLIGYTNYHKFLGYLIHFGGYRNKNEIEIYGKHRFNASYKFSRYWSPKVVWSLKQELTVISGAHRSINPIRSVTSFTVYPFPEYFNFGFQASFIHGHDNYNIRFVDEMNQFTVGLVFSPFGLFSMNNKPFKK